MGHHRVSRATALIVTLLVGACQTNEWAVPRTDEAALFAVADKVLQGRLEIISAKPDMYNIRIGHDIAYVGGDGLEIPDEAGELLRELQGVEVVAGVHGCEFEFGHVMVVMSYGKLALGSVADLHEMVAVRKALEAREDWLALGQDLEVGRWRVLLKREQGSGTMLEQFLHEFSASSIARDIAGWWIRTLGEPARKWPGGRIRIRENTFPIDDVRDAAKVILEDSLGLPQYLLTRYHWSETELAHRIWLLTKMRT